MKQTGLSLKVYFPYTLHKALSVCKCHDKRAVLFHSHFKKYPINKDNLPNAKKLIIIRRLLRCEYVGPVF